MNDSNVDRVIERHKERVKSGFNKYGVTTERTDLNLIQWLTHLQEEVMDAAVYIEKLKQTIAECKHENADENFFGVAWCDNCGSYRYGNGYEWQQPKLLC